MSDVLAGSRAEGLHKLEVLPKLRLWWATMGPWGAQKCHQRVKTSVNEHVGTDRRTATSNPGVKKELKNAEDSLSLHISHLCEPVEVLAPGGEAPCQTSSASPPMNYQLMSY